MKKVFFICLLASFLMAGHAFACQASYTVSVTDDDNYREGDVITTVFKDPDIGTTWSYCVMETTSIEWDTQYEYSLVDVADYAWNSWVNLHQGYSAAWLIYNAYNSDPAGTILSKDKQKKLQKAIWYVLGNNEYKSYYDKLIKKYGSYSSDKNAMLSSLFDIVVTYDSLGDASKVQNLIVYNPVPVPGAVWLLGSGLLGFVMLRRKKS